MTTLDTTGTRQPIEVSGTKDHGNAPAASAQAPRQAERPAATQRSSPDPMWPTDRYRLATPYTLRL